MALTPQFGSLVPTQVPQLLSTNYLQWDNNGGGAGVPENFADFAQQYLPEIYEAEVERYGNRTLSGFLKMVGAEMPMTSDQVIWSEQNRLHISYAGVSQADGAGTTSVITIPVADGVSNVISVNDTVVVLDPANGLEAKGIVTASTIGAAAPAFTIQPFTGTSLTTQGLSATGLKVFVYGSDYAKGSDVVGANARTSINPVLTQYHNSPIIIRDQYVVSGSDAATRS